MTHHPSMCTALISSGDDTYSCFAKQSGLTNILYCLQNTCSVIWEIEKNKKRWNKCWSWMNCSTVQNVALRKLPFNIVNETNGVPFFLIPFSLTVIEWSGDCEVKPRTFGSISMESQFFKTWWMPLGMAHFSARISAQCCTLSNSTQLSHYVVL